MFYRTCLFADDENMEVTSASPDLMRMMFTSSPTSKGDNCTPWKEAEGGTIRSKTGSKRRLFSTTENQDGVAPSPASKRFREAATQLSTLSLKDDVSSCVIRAMDNLITRDELIADGSRDHALPIIHGKELKSISPDTVASLLSGLYYDKVKDYTIIDCRYPYEFQGGHIKGALNLYTRQLIEEFLWKQRTSSEHHVLVFHCEFSSERGPKLYRYLRSLDRHMNKDHYPRLHFPEIYLLHGGYKAFFYSHKNLCDPDDYKPMLHSAHVGELRHFRAKSKSWVAGETRRKTRKLEMRSCSTVLF